MHLKRNKVPKTWPVFRKGTKYVIRPSSNLKSGIPILVVIREGLGIAQNRKEVKRAIHLKDILLNGKPINDEKNAVTLFDKITLIPSNKNYKMALSPLGKFIFEEIKEIEAGQKIAKIIDKKILKGKKVQLNLSDGRNFLSDIDCKVNDSVIVEFKKKKITKCLPLKEKANILVFAGKHAGEKGIITKINNEKKMVELEANEKKTNVLIKQIIVTL